MFESSHEGDRKEILRIATRSAVSRHAIGRVATWSTVSVLEGPNRRPSVGEERVWARVTTGPVRGPDATAPASAPVGRS